MKTERASFLFRSLFFVLIIFILLMSCEEKINDDFYLGTLKGQVYSLNTPGPIPVGWTPPPLEIISTIVVLNEQRKVIIEKATDIKGSFSISLEPGIYYLKVKESRIPNESGPFSLHQGEVLVVEAYYDNGMQ